MFGDPSQGLFFGLEDAFELEGLESGEEFAEGFAGVPALGDEIGTGDDAWGQHGLAGEFFAFCTEEVVVVQPAVGAEAVNAMQGEFVIEGGAGHEAAQLGGAHLFHVLEDHVVLHGDDGGLDDLVGEFHAAHDLAGLFGTEFVVTVEADAACVGVARLRGRFGDVVEEDAHDQRQRDLGGQQAEHEARVDEDVALGVELRWLLAALENEDLGEELLHEAAVDEEIEAANAIWVEHGFHELFADALDADAFDFGGEAADGFPGGVFDVEAEYGGEAHGA